MTVECTCYVGPPLMFEEMPECGHQFEVEDPEEPEDRPDWVNCPECGGEVLVEWGV